MQLYERLLGSSFQRLPPQLRRFHASAGGDARWALQVRRGGGRLAEAVAWLLALPKPTERAQGRLHVRASGDRETWVRVFPDREVRTTQRMRDGRLVETHGAVSFFFDVEVDERGLRFVDRGSALLGIRLPRRLAPSLSASVRSRADGWDVEVSLALPLLGTILSYGGVVTPA
jgi:Domain of unknown function (DUF4166)